MYFYQGHEISLSYPLSPLSPLFPPLSPSLPSPSSSLPPLGSILSFILPYRYKQSFPDTLRDPRTIITGLPPMQECRVEKIVYRMAQNSHVVYPRLSFFSSSSILPPLPTLLVPPLFLFVSFVSVLFDSPNICHYYPRTHTCNFHCYIPSQLPRVIGARLLGARIQI